MSALLFAPLLVPLLAAALIAPFDGTRPWLARAALGAMLATLGAMAALAAVVFAEGQQEAVAGGWEAGVGIAFRADPLGVGFALASLVVLVAALAHEVLAGVGDRRFPALVLFMAAGLNGLFLTGDAFNFYVFFELAMTSTYVLASYGRSRRETGPTLVLAVVNLLGSFIFLIGIAALYHATGTLDIGLAAGRLGDESATAAMMIAVCLFVAFGVKLGLFPFHFWIPAVYARAHPAVAAILAGALANIGAYGLLRFGAGMLESQLREASTVLIAIGAASILYGSMQAISRRSVSETLAYSSIGQVGYVLVAIGVGGPVGYAAAVVYALINSLNKGMLFLVSGLRGPLIGACFAIGAFSLIGVPPAAGFLGKLALLEAGAEAGSIAIVVLVALGGALSFVYALQIYQRRFWPGDGHGEDEAIGTARREEKLRSVGLRRLVAGFAVIILALGIWPQPLAGTGELAAESLIEQGAPR